MIRWSPRANVQRRVFQTLGCQEREQNQSVRIGSGLVGEVDGERAVVAEESGRVSFASQGF